MNIIFFNFGIKIIDHINEYVSYLDTFKLKELEEAYGFDPKNIFLDHIIYIGYNAYFEGKHVEGGKMIGFT